MLVEALRQAPHVLLQVPTEQQAQAREGVLGGVAVEAEAVPGSEEKMKRCVYRLQICW